MTPVWKSTSEFSTKTFVNLHAIEPTRSRGRRRLDGVGRPKFDFHAARDLVSHQKLVIRPGAARPPFLVVHKRSQSPPGRGGTSRQKVVGPDSEWHLCRNQNFTARSRCIVASTSTPSTRRLLDGVAMLVPHRSTGPERPHHRPEITCLLYTSPSPRDRTRSRMPSSA